ncbi:MAG: hypothetical protein ACYCQK_03500, partial [Acidiferrobacteraceae bacterium]
AAPGGHGGGDEVVPCLSAGDLAWADLCVILDGSPEPPLRSGLAVRHWSPTGTPVDANAYRAFLEDRISGILGGLRMIDRPDDASPAHG